MQHPGLGLKHQVRNDALLYLAPPVFVWAPASQFGQKTVCKRSTDKVHHLHSNGWYDTVAYDLTGPVYLRRRNMRCQKEVNGKPACPEYKKGHVVRDEGLHWCTLTKPSLPRVWWTSSSTTVTEDCPCLRLGHLCARSSDRNGCAGRQSSTQTPRGRALRERATRDYSTIMVASQLRGFHRFESYAYVPSRGLIKIIIVQ